MEKSNIVVAVFSFSLILVGALLFLFRFFEPIIFLFTTIEIVLLAVTSSYVKNKDRAFCYLALSSTLLSFLYFSLSSFFVDKAPIKEICICVLSNSFFLLLFLPLVVEKRKGRLSYALVAIAFFLIVIKRYLDSYIYLYREIISLDNYERFFYLSFLFLALAIVSFILFGTKKNWASYFFILLSSLFSFLSEEREKEITNPAFLFLLIFLVLYYEKDRSERIVVERRDIKLSAIKEEPIKNKKREKRFDIPPNVPLKDE